MRPRAAPVDQIAVRLPLIGRASEVTILAFNDAEPLEVHSLYSLSRTRSLVPSAYLVKKPGPRGLSHFLNGAPNRIGRGHTQS